MMLRTEIIQGAIDALGAKKYLEIGVGNGHTFRQIKAPHKTAVDVNFQWPLTQLIKSKKLKTMAFHKTTSNKFFRDNNETFDVVFVDGDHNYKQAYTDTVNALWCIDFGGVVVLHDTSPFCKQITGRKPGPKSQKYTVWGLNGPVAIWSGDVWKIVPVMINEGHRVITSGHDFGVSVIQKMHDNTKLTELNNKLVYEDLEKNAVTHSGRKTLLNLISPEYVRQFICNLKRN